ncbi:AraC family transcriptional regulator [Rhodococcus rhodochrous]|uniref:AraC family transcriptional regulator n=1 Tax=Rhodococcus rhodochrous KG-21 TaxID=1441923 RepID=A0A0M8PNM3_RHORH|nr:AraC family transcriptional regulator [Rhodococcus rhodochrous]KOS55398.1 AraC family transcriptional regulator [Rhodococcus rhodochrous KG-21]
MIAVLNRVVDLIEEHLTDEFDLATAAARLGTTEYHVRRMFSSLAGIPLSEYIRRRRMTIAGAVLISGNDDLLTIAVRFGYGSTEAFGRAFRAVHGVGPGEVRRDGGPLRTQPHLRFHLTVEGSTPMDVRILELPAFRLIGHATRVPLIYVGENPHIKTHVAAIPEEEHLRLKGLGNTEPAGMLAVSDDLDPDRSEGSELTYLHGVAVDAATDVPPDLDVINVPAGRWAAFRSSGDYPATLQITWAATATEWFPSNPWRLRPGPEIVAVLDRATDFSTATCDLWLPIEQSGQG